MSFGALAFSEQRPLAEEFELHVVDRRGFGRSPDADGRVDFDVEAGELAELLEAPAHVLGHSYGAIVCMLAAARRPARVRSLVVIEPPAFGLVPDHPSVRQMVARIDDVVRDGAAMSEEQYLRAFLQAWGLELGEGPTLNAVARRSVRRSIGERLPTEAELPLETLAAAPFPILVARGGWDAVPEAARTIGGRAFIAVCDVLVERLGAQEAVFPGAAHQPQLAGEPFNRRIAAFWRSA
jgi:pimeloyl-ACP methyl ester carboxylesterase